MCGVGQEVDCLGFEMSGVEVDAVIYFVFCHACALKVELSIHSSNKAFVLEIS